MSRAMGRRLSHMLYVKNAICHLRIGGYKSRAYLKTKVGERLKDCTDIGAHRLSSPIGPEVVDAEMVMTPKVLYICQHTIHKDRLDIKSWKRKSH